MDWSKAKTIIILALIVTNLFLLTMVYQGSDLKDPLRKRDFMDQALELLESKDISLDTELSRKSHSLKSLSVSYEDLNIDRINKNFFKNQANLEIFPGGARLYRDGEEVKWEKKLLHYKNDNPRVSHENLNRELAVKIGQDFLSARGFKLEDLEGERVYELKEGQLYFIRYSKFYKDLYLEKSYTEILIDRGGVRTMERLWLDVKDESQGRLKLQPASKAILDLVDKEDYRGRTIVDLSPCYYLAPEIDRLLDGPIRAVEGTALPAWRIEFEDGQVYIDQEY